MDEQHSTFGQQPQNEPKKREYYKGIPMYRRVIAIICGIGIITLITTGFIYNAVKGDSFDLTGGVTHTNDDADSDFSIVLSEQFIDQGRTELSGNSVYNFSADKDEDGHSDMTVSIILENIGPLQSSFDAVLQDGQTIEEYVFDSYLSDPAQGRTQLEGILEGNSSIKDVTVQSIERTSTTISGDAIVGEFTAVDTVRSKDVTGRIWFMFSQDEKTGYNLISMALTDSWEEYEYNIGNVIDTFRIY